MKSSPRVPGPLRLAAVAGCCAAALVSVAAAQDLLVYDNQLQNGFADWSWAVHDLAYAAQSHSPPTSIQMEPDGWSGLYFHRAQAADDADFLELRLWVKGVASGGQQLRAVVQLDGTERASVGLDGYLPAGGISGSEWREAVIPFAAIGLGAGAFNELVLQDTTGGDQAALLFDDIVFVADPTPPGPVAVTVDPNLDRREISAFVYGVNFASPTQLADVGYTVNRWGGNSTTRYNWQLDVHNSAFDWFFTNYTGAGPPADLPAGSEADELIVTSRAAGAEVVLTLPAMGLVAGPDRERRWGFSETLYGEQDLDECRYFGPDPADWPSWCNHDAGNGLCDPAVNTTGFCSPDGRIVGNDPADTSIAAGTSFATDWLAFVATRVGSSTAGGVRFVALDNEPMLWSSTHSDVHPQPATYDEVWGKGLALAQAAKAQDPAVQVLGPDTWGWCDLWTSAADAALGDCLDGPDRQAHAGTPFVEWYLAQVCAEAQSGVRPVDFLDVHYYPQSGEAFGGEEYAAVRLQSIRELDDPGYVSQSWIGTTVSLVPRLKAWVAAACPGVKVAISEYCWGEDTAPSAALAQAEVLAIFGASGVDLATRWVTPESGSKTEEAFRLFLDYDGAGATVRGESVRATTSDRAAVGAYAVRGHSDQLYLLLFNKDDEPRNVSVGFAAQVTGPAQLYRFTATDPLGPAGSIPVAGNALAATLPARSATLAVLELVSDVIFRDGFDSGTSWAWSSTRN